MGYSLWGCKESDTTERLSMWDKGLTYKIYKLLIHLTIQKNTPILKIGRGPERIFFQRKHPDGCQAQEKMFSITNHHGNAIQNHNDLSSYICQNDYYQKDNKCWRGCGEKGIPVHCRWKFKLVQPLRKTVWRFLKKIKIGIPHNPASSLLGIFLRKKKAPIWKDICTTVFNDSQGMKAV